MTISASAICFNVFDIDASVDFLMAHFGFHKRMEAPGFASLARDDAMLNVVFHSVGLEVLPASIRSQSAQGVILSFTVDNLEAEAGRLAAEQVDIEVPIREEAWGERLLVVRDPNGIRIQLLARQKQGTAAGTR